MSKDLSLSKGDIQIGPDGDLGTVENTSKLVQDSLKVLHTPIGSNPFFINLGSPITALNIGETLNRQFLESRVEADIGRVIQTIQGIQRRQELVQEVTPAERIEDLASLSAQQDSQDPRQFNINIKILTGATDVVQLPEFSLSTTIGGELT